jgi:hypothetical protein
MAQQTKPLYSEIEEVITPREAMVNARGMTKDSWWKWLWNLRRVVNDNFETLGVEDFSSAFAGRLTALEEEIRQLWLRDQARESEPLAADVPPAREAVQSVDVAPAAEAVQRADVTPAVAERAPEQLLSVSDVEEIRQRVTALEGSVGALVAVSSIAEALEGVREQAIADALSLGPAVETGQLFKPRQWVQFIDPSQMYLPVTQPAAGPNIYETGVNGSAWRCFEFAPGTLVVDNDNVEALVSPPLGWDGTPVGVRFFWTHAATVTNFVAAWRAQAGAYYDNTSGTAALSAENANVIQDVGGVTDNIYLSTGTLVTPASVSMLNVSNAFAPLLFRFGRRTQSESGVGLAVNARLIGVALIWNLRPFAAA